MKRNIRRQSIRRSDLRSVPSAVISNLRLRVLRDLQKHIEQLIRRRHL